jgi:hypothetical protein
VTFISSTPARARETMQPLFASSASSAKRYSSMPGFALRLQIDALNRRDKVADDSEGRSVRHSHAVRDVADTQRGVARRRRARFRGSRVLEATVVLSRIAQEPERWEAVLRQLAGALMLAEAFTLDYSWDTMRKSAPRQG